MNHITADVTSVSGPRSLGQCLRVRIVRRASLSDSISEDPFTQHKLRTIHTFNIFQPERCDLTGVGTSKIDMSNVWGAFLLAEPHVYKLRADSLVGQVSDSVRPPLPLMVQSYLCVTSSVSSKRKSIQ